MLVLTEKRNRQPQVAVEKRFAANGAPPKAAASHLCAALFIFQK